MLEWHLVRTNSERCVQGTTRHVRRGSLARVLFRRARQERRVRRASRPTPSQSRPITCQDTPYIASAVRHVFQRRENPRPAILDTFAVVALSPAPPTRPESSRLRLVGLPRQTLPPALRCRRRDLSPRACRLDIMCRDSYGDCRPRQRPAPPPYVSSLPTRHDMTRR